MRLTVYFSLIIVLALTACGGDTTDSNSDGTTNNEAVSTDDTTPTATDEIIPTPRPINPTLPPVNSTLPPPVATSATVSETVTAERGAIRVVNAIHDLPQVDIFVDGEAVERRMDLFSASRRATQLSPGAYQLSVVESTGVGIDSNAVVYFESSFDVEVDDMLLMVLSGTSDDITLSIFEEDMSPIEPGQARVMFANTISQISAAQLVEGSSVVVDGISTNSISESVELVARDHSFNIEESDGGFLTSFEHELESGFEYTVVLVGDLSNDIVAYVILENKTAPQSRVRITHAAPDVLAVDVVFDGTVVAENLSFGETLDFQAFPSKFTDVQIFDSESGTSSTPLLENRVNLPEHQSLEMVIFGQDNNLRVSTYTIDTSPIPVGFGRLVVFHAAIGEEGIRFVGPDDSEIGLSVRYGEFSTPLLIDVGSIEFRFGTGTQDDPRLVEAPANSITLEEGTSYTYIVTGRTDDNPLFLTYDVQLISQPEETGFGGGGNRVSVRVVNALFDNEAIRLELDETQITTRLQQYRISSPTSVEDGFHILRLYNDSDVLLYDAEISLEDFRDFTVIVIGEIQNLEVGLYPDFGGIPLTEVVVRYIHAAPDLPQVIIDYRPVSGDESLDPGVIVTPSAEEQDDYEQILSYSEVSVAIQFVGGLSQFSLTNRETFENIVTFRPVDLVGGHIYDILLVPNGDNGVELLLLDHGQ
jgi:hypothetical protein